MDYSYTPKDLYQMAKGVGWLEITAWVGNFSFTSSFVPVGIAFLFSLSWSR